MYGYPQPGGGAYPGYPAAQAYPGYPAAPPYGAQQPAAPYGALPQAPGAAPQPGPPPPGPWSSGPPASGPASSSSNAAYPSMNGSSGSALMYPNLGAPPSAAPPAQQQPADTTARPGPAPAPAPGYGYPQGAPQGSYAQAAAPAYGAPPPAYGAAPPAYGAPQQPATAPGTYGQPPPAPAAAPSYMPPTTYSPAPGHGQRRRRALLIGCAYPGTTAALNGCLNDVQCMQFLLKNRFGFTDAQIVCLRDDIRDVHFSSTKQNIYKGIQWLMTDQQPGDSLFFHFSGHGSQRYDTNGDEEDGYDETILPSDFQSAGQIVDDELNRMVVRPLLPGVTLHAVVDACHSGTVFDLPFRAKVDGTGRWYWKGRPRGDKMTMGGTAFQFGACKDSQVAQDTNRLSGKTYTGAATFCFIDAIEKFGAQQTYAQVLAHMMSALRSATGAPGVNLGSTGNLIASLLLGGAASAIIGGGQTPVLSCDKNIDLYSARLNL